MCSNYPGIKLEPAIQRKEDKIEYFSSCAHVVHITGDSRRGKNENVCQMFKNEKLHVHSAQSCYFSLSNMQILVAVALMIKGSFSINDGNGNNNAIN